MAKKIYLILMLFLIGAKVNDGNISPNPSLPFNPNQIIEQVSQNLVKEKRGFNHMQTYPSCETQKKRNKKDYHQPSDDEFLINKSIVTVQAPYERGYPVAASDGINYLIIWIDGRNPESHGEIFGTLVDQAGRIITPAGIAISTDLSYKSNPAVAFDGLTYLVVWEDQRNGEESDIYGKRIARFGSVLDTFDIPISTFQDNQENPSVAFDGIKYLVVWEDQRNQSRPDIYGARVNTSGVVLDTVGFSIVSTDYDEENPAVAFDGTNYLVIWEDYLDEDINGFRVNPEGVVIDTSPIVISSAQEWQGNHSIAFDGTNYLIVWVDERSNQTFDIYGTLVTTSGTVLDTNGFVISSAVHDQYSPSVTFTDSNYFVVWLDRRNGTWYPDIYGARVNQSGIVLDTNGILIDIPIYRVETPSVAFNGTNCLIAWGDEDTLEEEKENIVAARVNQSGIVLDLLGFLISTAANCQISPAIAFDGLNYLVVWSDSRNDNDIYGTRLNQFGEILDTNGIAISTAAGRQEEPSVSFDGFNYLVAWTDFRSGDTSHIYVTRVNRAGLVLDPAGILISSLAYYQKSPSVDFDGNNYLIVWEDRRSGNYDIYGTRLTPSCLVLDPGGIPISTISNEQKNPYLVFDGTNYLVVWEDLRSGSWDIFGARVHLTGVVLDSIGIPISTASYQQRNPSLAFDGINYLVVWDDYRNYNDDIYGTRVTTSGVVLDSNGIIISNTEEDQQKPFVAFGLTNYFVVWQDERNCYFNIYGAKVNLSGIVIDTFPISNQKGNQYTPVLSRKNENQILIAYSGWTETVQSETYNSMRIWGKFYPVIEIEENSEGKMPSEKLFKVYPNPAKSVIFVRCLKKEKNIKIFDVSGQLAREIAFPPKAVCNNNEVKISLNGISPGIYFLRFGKETIKFLVVK